MDSATSLYAKRTITVPSPALLSVPVEMTDATVFYQSVVYPLAILVVMEVIDQYPNSGNGGIASGSPSSTLCAYGSSGRMSGPLAVGREEVVRWLYQNAQAESVEARQAVPAGYERLCRTYRIWDLSPELMSIPLTAARTNATVVAVALSVAAQLNDFRVRRLVHRTGECAEVGVGSRVALETVIEYVVATYGRDHLPRLIAALGEHTSWQTLIPAVFDVSAAEFEAGWQAYLAHQYQ